MILKKPIVKTASLLLAMTLISGCSLKADTSGSSVSSPEPAVTIPAASVETSSKGDNKGETSSSSSDRDNEQSGNPKEVAEDTFVRQLLSRMTLEEKVAQMSIVAFDVWDDSVKDCFLETKPGGFILFTKNITSEEGVKSLTSGLTNISSEYGIPAFISVDQEGGAVQRLRFSKDYPKAADIGAKQDAGLSYDNGFEIGSELKTYGFNVDFAPVMDVNSNPKNPVIGNRSFSDKADVVSEMGTAMMKGLRDSGVIPCLKHFPGHGDTSTDSHTGLPKVDKTLEQLWETELIPFKAGIDAGADMIMTAHIEFPNIVTETKLLPTGESIALPATLSKEILTDLLRKEMGYEGVIVTDSFEMKAIASNFSVLEATGYAVCAGADIILMPFRITGNVRISEYKKYISDFAALVRSGAIPEERIDESVLRILKLKEKYGFFLN